MKAIAEDTGTSASMVGRVLNKLTVAGPKQLPEAVSFDEFKGNLGGERFRCIVTDPLNRRVLDLLPARTVETVQDCLRTFTDRELALDVLLRFSDKLAQAYALKEAFYSFMASADRHEAGHGLDFWLDSCDRLKIPQFNRCRNMLRNWRPYILNAFDVRLSNGFTEGCNNAVKARKRASFGFSNFSRSRKRILLSFS